MDWRTYIISLNDLQQSSEEDAIIPIWQLKVLRLGEVKQVICQQETVAYILPEASLTSTWGAMSLGSLPGKLTQEGQAGRRLAPLKHGAFQTSPGGGVGKEETSRASKVKV